MSIVFHGALGSSPETGSSEQPLDLSQEGSPAQSHSIMLKRQHVTAVSLLSNNINFGMNSVLAFQKSWSNFHLDDDHNMNIQQTSQMYQADDPEENMSGNTDCGDDMDSQHTMDSEVEDSPDTHEYQPSDVEGSHKWKKDIVDLEDENACRSTKDSNLDNEMTDPYQSHSNEYLPNENRVVDNRRAQYSEISPELTPQAMNVANPLCCRTCDLPAFRVGSRC